MVAVVIVSLKTFIEKYNMSKFSTKKGGGRKRRLDLTVMKHKAGSPEAQVGRIASTRKGMDE